MPTIDEMQVVVNAKTEGMRSELAKAADQVKAFADQSKVQIENMIGMFGKLQAASSPQQMLGIVGGVVGKANPFVLFATEALDAFDKLSKFHETNLKWSTDLINLSAVTGITTVRLQELGFAADKTNVQQKALADGLAEFKKRADQAAGGTGPLVKLFEDQGIAMKFADGAAKSYEQLLREISEAMKRTEGDSGRGKIALEAFGESGRQLVPIFKEGGKGLDEFANKAREAGKVSSDAMVQTVSFVEIEWKRRIDAMKSYWQSLVDVVVSGLERLGSKTSADSWMPTSMLEATLRKTRDEWTKLKADMEARTASDFALGERGGQAIGINPATGATIYDRSAENLDAMREKLSTAEKAFNEAAKRYAERAGLTQQGTWDASVTMPPPPKKADEDKPEKPEKAAKPDKETKDYSYTMTEYLERQIRQQEAYGEGLNKTAGEVAALRAEEEILARAKHYDIEITEHMRDQLEDLKEKLRETIDAAESWKKQLQLIQDVGRAVSSNLESAFRSFTENGKVNFKDMTAAILRDLAMIAFRASIIQPLFGTGGNNQGLFGNVIAGFLGTKVDGARAEGGDVTAGGTYLVGERGPELVKFGRSGVVIPNNAARALAAAQGVGGNSNARPGGEVVVTLHPSELFDAHIESRTQGVVAQAAPQIVRAASADTQRRLPTMLADAQKRRM